VDVITERPGLRRFSLPIGMSVDAVGGARLVVRDDDEIVGIDIASGDPVWRLPFRGIHAGSYVTSDDAFYVTSIRAGHATPAPLQLVVVDLRSDEVRVLREWKAGEPAPNFIPELSSDTTAVFLTEAIDIDDYLHLGAGRVDAVAVDLTTGELSSGSFELSVEPAL
jgi:outer membrane protein assembly factor BamB